MIMSIISTQPLVVEVEDFRFVGTVASGRDKGKHAYINSRWTTENADKIFDGEDLESSLVLLQKEVLSAESLFDTLALWFDETAILVLSPAEIHEFNEYYSMIRDPGMVDVLLQYQYDETATIAENILVNELDVLIKMSRRPEGGN